MAEISAQVSSAINGLMNEYNIIANNLANVSTPAYKRQCNTFSKILSAQTAKNGTPTDGEIKLESTYDFSAGNLNQTGRDLDLAICGKGFFVIETPQGPLYTRNGSFNLNSNGQLVDVEGRAVQGDNGPITIPAGAEAEITVGNDGTISAGKTSIGKIKIVDFGDNENKLNPAGLNCYKAPINVQPITSDKAIVKQGYTESSNVNMMEELVDMIMVSRLYEANMKSITIGTENSKSLMSVAMG